MKLRLSAGLRARLIAGVLLASLPAVVTLFLLAKADREHAYDRASREVFRAAAAVAREHERLILTSRELLVALAQVPAIRRGRGTECEALLAGIKATGAAWYANFAVVQPNGDIECSALPLTGKMNIADAPFVRDARATGGFVPNHYQIGPISGVPTLALSYPVASDGGDGEGVVVYAAIDLTWLETHPQWSSLPEGATLLILDREGKVVLLAPPLPAWSNRNIADSELGRLALSGRHGTFVASGPDGERRLYGRAELGGDQRLGVVLVSIPDAPVTAAADSRGVLSLGGLAVTLLLIVGLGWVATEFLVLRGLSPIMETVCSVAAGKLDARTGMRPGSDEIRQVAQAVDVMAGTLERQRTQAEQAEQARRHSEARLQAIFDSLSDAAVFVDTGRRIRLVNPAFTRIFGYAQDEVLGRTAEPLYADPQDYAEHGRQYDDPRSESESSTPCELRYRRKDGSEFWAESVGVRMVSSEGTVIGHLTLLRDVSARRWAEQALRESEERLRLAARVAGFGIFEHDHEADVVFLSDEMAQIIGSKDTPIDAASLLGQIHPADRERIMAAIARAHDPRSGGIFASEHRYLRADGEVRWLSIRAQTFFAGESTGRHPVRTIGAAFDITERRRAEERFRRLVEAAPSAILLVNAEGRIALVNAEMEKLFGYRRAELIGEPVEVLLPERYRGGHGALRAGFIASPRSRAMGAGRDLFGLHKDGREIPLEIGLSPIHTEEGVLVMAFIADITRRKEAEEAVMRLNAELERRVEERTAELVAANRELDSFAYAVSHDLRGPLRALSGFSAALLEDYGGKLDQNAQLYLEQIGIASRRMADLVEGLLALSRSTRGEIRRDRVDLSAMSERLLAELARLDAERTVHWEVEAGMVAWGDERMIEAVMGNLLDNAWKYTSGRPDARIRVYSSRQGERTCFCVADNGAGFDMAYAAKLFQPFQRLHRQDEFPGIGIGLATAQRIVHRHGGEIHAQAAPGCGATFCFHLGGEGAEAETRKEHS